MNNTIENERWGMISDSGNYYYTQVSKEFMLNPDISLKAKGMLCLLLSLPKDQRFYKYQLPQFSKDKRDGTSAAFEELVDGGYIEVVPNKSRKPQDWKYIIKDTLD